ncbi:MAG: phosphotransferase [Mycobacterium sp.]
MSTAIPSAVDELTPEWFGEVLHAPVHTVDVLDAHSGTTGRARVALTGSPELPRTVFVKLQPFAEQQRKFLRMVGLGVAEARFYATVGNDLPVRSPRVWHAQYEPSDGAFVMVLEDLTASGVSFPTPADNDILDVATSATDELATLHHTFRGRDLTWLTTPPGMRRAPKDSEVAAQRTRFIEMALAQFGDEMGPAFRTLAQLYIDRAGEIMALFRDFGDDEHTLIHGDTHSGNLFVDHGRTGFYDWAVAGRGPGMRDVAYFLCNSLPTDLRRGHEDDLLTRYRSARAAAGSALDTAVAHQQYRLFAVYSWIAAVSTAAMGSSWQPFDIAHAAMLLTTRAIEDLDAIGLLQEQLGISEPV